MNKEYTIFYTDDDAEDLEFFIDASNEIGNHLKIVTQNNGNKLLYDLKNPPPNPHLIFLDLNMPGINGFDVLTELRGSEEYKEIPVIVFSTSSDSDAITRSWNLGANYYIKKPTDFSFLKKVIQHTLSIDWNTFKANKQNFVYN